LIIKSAKKYSEFGKIMKKTNLLSALGSVVILILIYSNMVNEKPLLSPIGLDKKQTQIDEKKLISNIQKPSQTNTINKNMDEYIDNKDGTVTFKDTDLMWQRCAVGQIWNGITCEGDAEKYTWYSAMKLTNHFAQYDNWRLPTQKELMALLICADAQYDDKKAKCLTDTTVKKPSINTALFPNTQSLWFWSSSPYAYSNHYAWYIDFHQGLTNYNDKNAYMNVRLVRIMPR
jgi:hypothetical protein